MKNEAVSEWIDRLRTAAMKEVTEDDMREIFKSLAERAKTGDREAIRLLMTYLQPPPPAPEQRAPAQQVKANVVNIYSGRRKQPGKLVRDEPLKIEHRNGN